MPFNYGFKLGSIQEISLLDADAITKRLKSLRRANKCRDRMTMFNRLPNDLQPRAPGGSQYNQLHAASLSRTLSAFGERLIEPVSMATGDTLLCRLRRSPMCPPLFCPVESCRWGLHIGFR